MHVASLVFVVDDDAAICESLKFLLEIGDWSVRTCSCGPELLAHADLHRARSILLDWQMPGMDGFQVLAHLTARCFQGAVIMMSGAIGKDMQQRALSAGAFAFLEKPFAGEQITTALNATPMR